MKGFILSCYVLLFTIIGNTQILIGGTESTNKKDKKNKSGQAVSDTLNEKLKDGTSAVYFVANWSNTFRSLKENGDLYGDSLGVRENETPLNVWSYGVGIQNCLSKHFMWDGGISIIRNGESYSYTATDTSFSSKAYYTYIGMPIRINYTVGNDFKFFVGAGIVPQMFSGFKQENEWTKSDKSKESETIKTRIGYNSFVVSAVLNVGLILNFQNNWALKVSPEARIQLSSSYQKTADYIHKARAYGITFGLIRNL